MFGKIREGFTMNVSGIHLTRSELHIVAAELGIATRDVLTKDGVLTIYNTTDACQAIVEDNALASMVALALEISPEAITNIEPVVEEPVKIEFDFDDEDEDD